MDRTATIWKAARNLWFLAIASMATVTSSAEDYSVELTPLLYQSNAAGTYVYLEIGVTDNLGRTDVVPFEFDVNTFSSPGSSSLGAFEIPLRAMRPAGVGGGGGFVDPQSIDVGSDQRSASALGIGRSQI